MIIYISHASASNNNICLEERERVSFLENQYKKVTMLLFYFVRIKIILDYIKAMLEL